MGDLINNAACFLHKFSCEDRLKYLLHDFDAGMDNANFLLYANKARNELAAYQDKLPASLFSLLYGFLYGPQWIDYRGNMHDSFNCANGELFEWCVCNNGKHPITEDLFKRDFDAFKNSIRIYMGDLTKELNLLTKSISLDVKLDTGSLDKVDCYVDVRHLHQCIKKILDQFAQPRWQSSSVLIEASRTRKPGKKYTSIRLSHIESFASISFEEMKERFDEGHGDLASLANSIKDHFYWSIETRWQGKPIRWNIIRKEGENEVEELDDPSTIGFTHILTIYNVTA